MYKYLASVTERRQALICLLPVCQEMYLYSWLTFLSEFKMIKNHLIVELVSLIVANICVVVAESHS